MTDKPRYRLRANGPALSRLQWWIVGVAAFVGALGLLLGLTGRGAFGGGLVVLSVGTNALTINSANGQNGERPSPVPRASVIAVSIAVAAGLVHSAVWSATSSSMVRLIVDVILIAVLAPAIVSFFRTLLRASEEEVKRNPRPW
jgi:hypothetical protein